VDIQINHLPYELVRWIPKDEEKVRILKDSSMSMVVLDKDENYAVLLLDKWKANWLSDRYGITFFSEPPKVTE